MSQVIATGGDSVFDITENGTKYRVHVFTTVGSSNFVVTKGGAVEYLIVGGGGGGGGNQTNGGGGGGAGGLLAGSTSVVSQSYPVTVGAGGTGRAADAGLPGGNSTFIITALGGGAGGGDQAGIRPATIGGSGGGGGSHNASSLGAAGTAGQGNAGGNNSITSPFPSGGGGGAGAAGSNASGSAGGNGGVGIESSITGTPTYYAGGGGGGTFSAGTGGTGGLGGGGNGGSQAAGTAGTNGLGAGGGNQRNGGSGIVIIRYELFPTPWEPSTSVSIAGTDFTGDTVGTVSITRGRDNVYADPTAGFATVRLIDKTGVGFDIDPTSDLVVTLDDSGGNPVILFTGTVTDIDRELYDPGLRGSPASITSVTAVGPLARVSRRQTLTGGRPAELDGERIIAALEESLGVTWEELPYPTWDSIPASVTWATISPGFDPDLIDPGLFELVALDPQDGGYQALSVALDASRSGQGILYETADGYIAWANADERATATNYLDIPRTLLTASDVRTFTSLSDIVNVVEVTYDGGSEEARDDTSIPVYRRWDRRIETLLANQSDAAQYAADYVRRHSYPTVNLDKVTIRVDGLPDTTADDLLALDVNSPVTLRDLPATFRVADLPGFVEGIGWRIDAHRAQLELTVSDANLSTGDLRWTQIDPAETWADLDAMLEWQDWR